MNDHERVAIGRILKARGLRGELKMKPISNVTGRFEALEKVFIEFADGRTEDYSVEFAKFAGPVIRLKLAGIDDRDAADRFRGVYVLVDFDDVAPLDDDTYYVFDLEGLMVLDKEGAEIGTVIRINSYPASDVLVIKGESGEIMVPAVKDYILKVDLDAGEMTVDLQKGAAFSADSGHGQ